MGIGSKDNGIVILVNVGSEVKELYRVKTTHMTAAIGSVALGTAVAHPLDTIKTIVQVGSSSTRKLTSAQIVDRMLSSSGYSGFCSDLGWSIFGRITGIARDSVFGGAFFSTWQFLHFVMLDFKALEMNPRPKSDEEIGPLSPLAGSGVSGSIAAMASHGFDTARSCNAPGFPVQYLLNTWRYCRSKVSFKARRQEYNRFKYQKHRI
ncbi:hypothetical protein AKJ16_DCAP25113 [Drosera capensis]